MDLDIPPLSDPKPLPRVPGPKLAPFTPTAHAAIEFVEELGNPNVDLDGLVWKVRINGVSTFYVLKMFRFITSDYLQVTVGSSLTRLLATPELWVDYFHPFNAECRAYGRLQDEGRQDLAIPAHGYLLLTPEQESEVAQRCSMVWSPDIPDNERDPWGRMDEHHGRPVHAIVKQLAADDYPFTPGQVGDMWRDLEQLHALGILVRDIKIFNYLGGKLIDFSRAWTVPHPALEYIHPRKLEKQRQRDPMCLHESIVDWGLGNAWDWDKVDIPEDLENCVVGQGPNDRYGIDVTRYDWRKWEEDLDALDAFLESELYAPRAPKEEEAVVDDASWS